MTMYETCQRVLAWCSLGVVSESEVIAWADHLIGKEDAPPSWLLDLSTQGVELFVKSPQPKYPRPEELSFVQQFRLLVETFDANEDAEVQEFGKWLAHESIGEDFELPEVKVGYEIEHASDYENSGDPNQIARAVLQRYRAECTEIQRWREGWRAGR